MKPILLSLPFLFLAFSAYAQTPPGKPSDVQTEEGFTIKTWLLTPKQFAAFAKKLDLGGKKPDEPFTHGVVVEAKRKKKPVTADDAEVWFHIIYPNEKNLMPRLMPHGKYYIGRVDLNQKGEYTFMVHVNTEDETPAVTFEYVMK